MTRRYALWELTRRLWPFFKPFLGRYSVAVALLVITSLLSLLPPYLVKLIIDNGIKAGNVSVINAAALGLLAITMVSGVTRGLMDYTHEWVSGRFITSLRAHLFSHVLRQQMGFFSTVKTGDILGRLRTDITAVYGVLVNTFIGALSEVIQIAGITVFLFYLNVKLALIALSFAPLLYFVLLYFGRRLRHLSRRPRQGCRIVGLHPGTHRQRSDHQTVQSACA